MTRIPFVLWVLATFTLVKVSGERRHYHGYKVLRVLPSNEIQLKSLATLKNDVGVNFWMPSGGVGLPADVMVSPEESVKMTQTIGVLGLPAAEVWIEDVEQLIENERVRMESIPDKVMNWEDFQPYETIVDWLDSLIATNDRIKSETIGQSTEGRDLRVYKVSSGTTNEKAKQAVWIDATIHAREWISTATNTYIINQLVTEPDKYTDILDAVDFYFLPVVNPDGYKFSFSDDRLWRKTRSNYANYTGDCIGVDANRNFGFHYGEGAGSSTDPCSEAYRGPNAYSEPEVKALKDYILSQTNQTNWNTYITLHCYGQLWLSPYGYSVDVLPDNYEEIKALSDDAVAALTAVNGRNFTTGTSAAVLYPSAGTSRDWAKGEGGFKYAYTIELRGPRGRGDGFGFVLPPDQILPTAIETWTGIQVVARKLVSQ